MKTGPRAHTLLIGLMLIVVTNAVALGGVAYNRSGTPDSVLKLTERELWLPNRWGFDDENSGIALNLKWRTLAADTPDDNDYGFDYSGYYASPVWLDKDKLAAIGFDVSVPASTPEGRLHYDKQFPHDALLVLEFAGPSYQQAAARARTRASQADTLLGAKSEDTKLQQQARDARTLLEREQNESSRLFVVDAGLDEKALRDKYSDRERYAIVTGQIEMQLVGPKGNERFGGRVGAVNVSELNVPLEFRPAFESSLKGNYPTKPDPRLRYEATVAFGRRHEPWLLSASRK